jgi:hypothetical protein
VRVGVHAHPLSLYLPSPDNYKVAVYAPAERADTPTPLHLYPYVLCKETEEKKKIKISTICKCNSLAQFWGIRNYLIRIRFRLQTKPSKIGKNKINILKSRAVLRLLKLLLEK